MLQGQSRSRAQEEGAVDADRIWVYDDRIGVYLDCFPLFLHSDGVRRGPCHGILDSGFYRNGVEETEVLEQHANCVSHRHSAPMLFNIYST